MMNLLAIEDWTTALSLSKWARLGSMVAFLFHACGGGMYGHFRSITLLTTRSFSQARCARSSFPLSFAADDGDMVGAGAVDVKDKVVDEEESPWAYCNDAQQHLYRQVLVCMFAKRKCRREVQRCSKSILQCRSGALAVASTSPLSYGWSG